MSKESARRALQQAKEEWAIYQRELDQRVQYAAVSMALALTTFLQDVLGDVTEEYDVALDVARLGRKVRNITGGENGE